MQKNTMALYSEFSPWKMVIFHSYVSLPGGNSKIRGTCGFSQVDFAQGAPDSWTGWPAGRLHQHVAQIDPGGELYKLAMDSQKKCPKNPKENVGLVCLDSFIMLHSGVWLVEELSFPEHLYEVSFCIWHSRVEESPFFLIHSFKLPLGKPSTPHHHSRKRAYPVNFVAD